MRCRSKSLVKRSPLSVQFESSPKRCLISGSLKSAMAREGTVMRRVTWAELMIAEN